MRVSHILKIAIPRAISVKLLSDKCQMDSTDDKSALNQVMAWGRQAQKHKYMQTNLNKAFQTVYVESGTLH